MHKTKPSQKNLINRTVKVSSKPSSLKTKLKEKTQNAKEQKEKLLLGKAALENEGIYTDTFMAPGHSYDRNTLKALKTIGFEYVTDGRTKESHRVSRRMPCRRALARE